MATAVAVVAVLGGAQQSRQARKERKKARKIQEKRAKLETSRAAVEQIRKAQIARSNIIQQGENQGVAGSSAVAGGAGSVQSQAGSNIAFTQQLFSLQQAANRRLEKASDFEGNAQVLNQIATFSASLGGPSARADGGAPVTDITGG